MYLYLGDDDITRAAAYLSGIMTHFNIPFERVDSSASPAGKLNAAKYDAYILSDYPRKNFQPGQLESVRDAVAQGAGLLMIGGWESFHGRLGEYHDSALADVLPVTMHDKDDRRNFSQGVFVLKHQDHPILAGLPWEKPPFIGGLNIFKPKPNTHLLLQAVSSDVRIVKEDEVADYHNDSIFNYINKPVEERFSVSLPGGDAMFLTLTETHPLLVTGQYGRGRTAALATDAAPHWVGGFVDWGKKRICPKLSGNEFLEFGEDYARFFAQLVSWTGKQLG
jgi:uncharacterized membrane protein